jgi:hypothetical protein
MDATAVLQPAPWLSLQGNVEYLTPHVRPGRDPNVPSIEAMFSNATVPAVTADLAYVRTGAHAVVDYSARERAFRGRYSASFDRYSDRPQRGYSFNRWDLDLQQFLPLVVSSRVLAVRTHVASTTTDAGNEVPFYLQPALGGSHSVRSLRAFRLRDRHALLMQAEYRWRVNAFLAGVLFYDAGKVASRRGDLNFRDLKDDYGFGLRVGFANTLALRAEFVLGGDEGRVIALRFGDVF